MRLRSATFRGVTRFTGAYPVSIDFENLGPGLVALVGRNGEGKTTVAESPAAALFKAFPSRPGFYENFSGKDAFIEATFEDAGDELTVRIAVDAERRITEGYVLRGGQAVTDGKAASFDAAVIERFGSYPLFLASVFAAQNKAGNFLGLRKGDRKSLFLELLNLGYLEILAQEAREQSTTADAELRAARQRVADIEAEVAALPDLQGQATAALVTAEAAAGQLDTARQEETAAIAALERARTAGERLAALTAAETSARGAYLEAHRALETAKKEPERIAARLKERLAAIEARKVHELEPAAERRAQERRAAVAARKVEDLEPAARKRRTDAVEGIERERGSIEKVLAEVPDAKEARERLGELESERRGVEEAQAQLATLEGDYKQALAVVGACEKALKRAGEARDAEVARLERQAGLLDAVPCRPLPEISGGCQLLKDAREAAGKLEALRAKVLPEFGELEAAGARCQEALRIFNSARDGTAELDRRLSELKAEEQAARTDVAKAQAAAGLRAQLTRLDERRAAAERTLEKELAAASNAVEGARIELERINQDFMAALDEADRAVLQATRESDAAKADAYTSNVVADEAILEAAGKADAARQDHAGAQLSLSAARQELDGLDAEKAERNAGIARADREAAERALREADNTVAGLRAKIEQLGTRAKALEALRPSAQAIEERLGDWRLLERSLGKDGVQALEIDAAGPEVARLTNELLTACYGPRFSLTFETTRQKRDGGQMEVFDVRVFDGPRERPVEALSGGEKVVVGEAVGLAFAIFNARKSGIRWETLWRDETAGALDPENAQAYVRMLRRARELGGFHQVIFVSHQPEVWEQADARLLVDGGKVVPEGRRAA